VLEKVSNRPSLGGGEERFSKAIFEQISAGDVVWDVGANLGYYTTRFADAVGSAGTVVAFEPYEPIFLLLTNAVGGRKNVELVHCALGDADGHAPFYSSPASGQNYNIFYLGAPKTESRLPVSQVSVMKGDTFRLAHTGLSPTCVKIDVEGFEYEVLLGMTESLKSSQLRSLFIEVHFTLLKERGVPDAPRKIVALLRANGFRTRWTGPCHLVASR